MTNLVEADGPILDRILDDTYEIWSDGLTRHAYGWFYTAQIATPPTPNSAISSTASRVGPQLQCGV